MILLVVGAGLAAVAGLSGVLVVGRRARKREQTAATDATAHTHYCAECDEEWGHTGRTCLYPWASACPKCSGAADKASVTAARSRA
jgi:hypothetical protein